MKMNVTTWKNLKHNVKNFGYWKTKYDSIYTKFKTCKTKNILQTYVLKL